MHFVLLFLERRKKNTYFLADMPEKETSTVSPTFAIGDQTPPLADISE